MNTTKTNEKRTIEHVEAELENVKKAEAALRDELGGLAGQLDQALGAEAEAVSQTMRSGGKAERVQEGRTASRS